MSSLNRATRVIKNRGVIGFIFKLRDHISTQLHSEYALRKLNTNKNVEIHSSSTLARYSKIETDGAVSIGAHCNIEDYAMLLPSKGSINIGSHSTLNPYSILYGHGGLEIGDGVRIAAHTVVIPANHKFESQDSPIWTQGLSKEGIQIDDDVWIGANCTVLDGVTVGEGSVVAAGAVVTEPVPPNTVVAGVPAEPIDYR